MSIEDQPNHQRQYLKTEVQQRRYIKNFKANSPDEQLKKIYTKTLYNKYNQFMNVLANKQVTPHILGQQDIKKTYIQVLNNNGSLNQQNQRKSVLDKQVRIRKFNINKNSKQQSKQEAPFKQNAQRIAQPIQKIQLNLKNSSTFNNLQSIYRMPPPPKPIKIQPIGVSTKSTYFGIKPFDRNPDVWIDEIKKRLNNEENTESMQKVLKDIQLL